MELQQINLKNAGDLALKKFCFKEALHIFTYLARNYKDSSYDETIKLIEKLLPYEKYKGLAQRNLLDVETLQKALLQAKKIGVSLEKVLMETYKISKDEILRSVESFLNIPSLDLMDLIKKRKIKISKLAQTIKLQFFEEALAVPLEYEGETYLCTYYPEDKDQLHKLFRVIQVQELKVAFSLREDILEFLSNYHKVEALLKSQTSIEEIQDEEYSEKEDVLVDSAIVNLVNSIIETAYQKRASDIHFDSLPGKKGILVRFRVDGECFDYLNIPEDQKKGVISRIKIMSNLDIAEKRLPQDGKIKFRTREGKTFEIRVATLPTIEGNENVVMRILGGIEIKSIEELGLLPENLEKLRKILDMPYGLILCVGPTGSGKTTTLHACLKYLNKPSKKIWTAEDPVEIVQEGLCQVQVKPKIGLTFARVLRAFLRADPDVIMLGETRDEETAHTLIESALTGHLVLSTLHTNSAPETITRLLGMGIDPFNFADSLLGVLAQRLAKRLCENCKEPYKPNDKELKILEFEYGQHPLFQLTEDLLQKATFFAPSGCEICHGTGFKGRIALHELLIPDEELKDLIINKAPAQEIREMALKKGMLTLKQDGILKVLQGKTTLNQVLSVTIK